MYGFSLGCQSFPTALLWFDKQKNVKMFTLQRTKSLEKRNDNKKKENNNKL